MKKKFMPTIKQYNSDSSTDNEIDEVITVRRLQITSVLKYF